MATPRTVIALVGVAAAAALAAAGCASPCQELGDRVCLCQPQGSARTQCDTDVKNRVGEAGATSAQQSFCSSKLDTCPTPPTSWSASAPPPVCALLNTCQGKINCGLALPQPLADGGTDGGCIETPEGNPPVTPFPDGGSPDGG